MSRLGNMPDRELRRHARALQRLALLMQGAADLEASEWGLPEDMAQELIEIVDWLRAEANE